MAPEEPKFKVGVSPDELANEEDAELKVGSLAEKITADWRSAQNISMKQLRQFVRRLKRDGMAPEDPQRRVAKAKALKTRRAANKVARASRKRNRS